MAGVIKQTGESRTNAARNLSRLRPLSAFLIYASVAGVFAALTDGVLRDDAYIFFQYARNLVETGTLSFNAGEPSYGITSISWTLVVAGGTVIFRDPVMVAKVFGLVLGALGALFWAQWSFRSAGKRISLSAVAMAALWPTTGADRMVEGMESGLLCFLSGLLLVTLSSQLRARHFLAGLLAGLLILTRPEMMLFVVILGIVVMVRSNVRSGVAFVLPAAVASAWWPLWLHSQTGSFFPPTRIGKLSVFLPESLGVTLHDFESGSVIQHVRWGITAFSQFAFTSMSSLSFLLLLVFTVLFLVLAARRMAPKSWCLLSSPVIATITLLALYCCSFPLLQLRYFVWLVPAMTYALYLPAQTVISEKWFTRCSFVALLVLLALLPSSLLRRIESTKIQQIRRTVGETTMSLTPPKARIALEPIGEIGYYAGRYIVDMGGLINTDMQACLSSGYTVTDRIWNCLVDRDADYLITYDNDGFLGRLPRDFPDRFVLVTYVPDQPVEGIRYRLLRIIRQ